MAVLISFFVNGNQNSNGFAPALPVVIEGVICKAYRINTILFEV